MSFHSMTAGLWNRIRKDDEEKCNSKFDGSYLPIPIERDGKLCGVVSVRDALKFLVQRLDEPEPAVSAGQS